MDKDKEPGIKVESIILVESFFKRIPNVVLPVPMNININVANNINNEKKQLITEMKVSLNSDVDPVYANIVYVGIFSVIDQENITLQQFAEHHAPAYLFPYVREEIHNRSIKAGLHPIIIQPLNFIALNKCH